MKIDEEGAGKAQSQKALRYAQIVILIYLI